MSDRFKAPEHSPRLVYYIATIDPKGRMYTLHQTAGGEKSLLFRLGPPQINAEWVPVRVYGPEDHRRVARLVDEWRRAHGDLRRATPHRQYLADHAHIWAVRERAPDRRRAPRGGRRSTDAIAADLWAHIEGLSKLAHDTAQGQDDIAAALRKLSALAEEEGPTPDEGDGALLTTRKVGNAHETTTPTPADPFELAERVSYLEERMAALDPGFLDRINPEDRKETGASSSTAVNDSAPDRGPGGAESLAGPTPGAEPSAVKCVGWCGGYLTKAEASAKHRVCLACARRAQATPDTSRLDVDGTKWTPEAPGGAK